MKILGYYFAALAFGLALFGSPETFAKKRDYYEVLGVDRKATEQDLKKAYRKLSKLNHPDLNPGDKAKEEAFKEISEAYEVLSDQERRAQYDLSGSSSGSSSGAPYSWDSNESFNWNDFARHFSASSAREETQRAVKLSRSFLDGFEFLQAFQGPGGRVIEAAVYWSGRREGVFFWQPNGSFVLHEILFVGSVGGQSRDRKYVELNTTLFDPRFENGFAPFILRDDRLTIGSKTFTRDYRTYDQSTFTDQFPSGAAIKRYRDAPHAIFMGYTYEIYRTGEHYYIVATPMIVNGADYKVRPRFFAGTEGNLMEYPLSVGSHSSEWLLPDGSGKRFIAGPTYGIFIPKYDPHSRALLGQVVNNLRYDFQLYGPVKDQLLLSVPPISAAEAQKISLPKLLGEWLEVVDTAIRSPLDVQIQQIRSTQMSDDPCVSILGGGGIGPRKKLN